MIEFPFVCVCVCLYVHGENISQMILWINLIFGGILPCDPGRKTFDFEKKNRSKIRGGG